MPEPDGERYGQIAVKRAFLVHYQFLLRWFAAQSAVLRRVYRGPAAFEQEAHGGDEPSPATSDHTDLWTTLARRLLWVPDLMPGLARSRHFVCHVLRAPLPNSIESAMVALQEEFERSDQSLNERAIQDPVIAAVLGGEPHR